MNQDIRKRRRQVAWLCFAKHLDEQHQIQAIEILESRFQMDGISHLIAYINTVCTEFAIDAVVRKSLYAQFHELMAGTPDLKFDPITHVLAKEQTYAQATPVLPPAVQSKSDVFIAVMSDADGGLDNDTLATRQLPDYTMVFKALMTQLMAYLPRQEEFFATLKELSVDKVRGSKQLVRLINAWAIYPEDYDWSYALTEQSLSIVVRLVHTAFCELLGASAADECFQKALASCAQIAEARHYPPSRFL